MKKIILVFSMLLLFSCRVREDEIAPTNASLRNESKLVSRTVQPGDPNLNPNFDWTTNTWTVYYQNPSGNISTTTSLNPFIDGTQAIFGNVDTTKADMYPLQGWSLICRDFGTPTSANTYPFIIFYNKIRGLIRVCILRTYDNLTSYQRISLGFAVSNPSNPNLFKFASNPVDLKTFNASSTFQQSAITKAGIQQWMIGEFNVQGYQATIENNTSLLIALDEVVDSTITLSGTIKLDGTAEPQSQGIGFWSGLKTVGTFVASGVDPIIAITANHATASNITSNSGTLLSAISDFVTGFTGGGGGSTYDIKLNGTINQSGTITTTNPRTSFSVYLKNNGSVGYHALQDIQWGVFDFIPSNYTKTSTLLNIRDYMYRYTATLPIGYITKSLKLNPNIVNQIDSIYVGDISNTGSVSFIPLSQYDSITHSFIWIEKNGVFSSGMLPKVGIQIKFTNGAVIYHVMNL